MERKSRSLAKQAEIGLLVLLGLLGSAMVGYNTRWGPGLTGDSIVYIQGAENLLAGNGYAILLGRGEVEKIAGFPPITSVFLALSNLGLGDMVTTGRWLNVVLMGLNVFAAGWIVLRYSRSLVASLFCQALVLASLSVLQAHTSVMSEGLFILFMLLAIWSLAEFLEQGRSWLLVLSGLLAAAATLTRYVGLVLIPIAGLALLFFGRRDLKLKLKDLLIFGLASLVPVGLWLLRNQLGSDNALDRQIGFHPMSQEMRGSLIDHVLSWFYLTRLGLPWRVRVPLFVVLFALVLGWFTVKDGWFLRRRQPGEQPLRSLPYMLAVLLPVYVFAIWVNTSVLDPRTSAGALERYLVPVLVTTVILFVGVAHRLGAGARHRWAVVIPSILIGAGLLWASGQGTWTYLFRRDDTGYGYTDNIRYWPGEIAALESLDTDRPIVTNDIQLIYALSGRYAYPLPRVASEGGGRAVDAKALQAYLSQGDYLVVIWRYGQTMADVFDASLVAGYLQVESRYYLAIYVDPAYSP
jgi:hypothetical protein